MTLVRRAVAREGHEDELQAVVEQALVRTVERLKHANIVVDNDVSPDEAKAVLAELVKIGLLRPPDETLEEERQALAREREELRAMRQELSPA